MTDKVYIGLADTAKLIRKALAKSFPGVKFYVRSRSYSGGSSIDIYYDGTDDSNVVLVDYDGNVLDPTPRAARDADYRLGRWANVPKPGMPKKRDVNDVVSVFAGHGFDGMIDMQFPIDAFIDAAGNIVTGSSGTGGSHGSVPAWGPDDDAGLTKVRFGTSFVFVNDTLPYGVGKAA